jgi:hypothetical protein
VRRDYQTGQDERFAALAKDAISIRVLWAQSRLAAVQEITPFQGYLNVGS